MPLSLGHAYLAVRDVASGGGPEVGAGWTVQPESDSWYVLRRTSDDLRIAAWRANSSNGRALWAVWGPQSFLTALAAAEAQCMPAREAWERRNEAAVRVWLRRWPVWRVTGQIRLVDGSLAAITDLARRLIPEGGTLPDPTTQALPWLLRADGTLTAVQAEAVIRVTAISRPAFLATLAGFDLHTIAEDEPPR